MGRGFCYVALMRGRIDRRLCLIFALTSALVGCSSSLRSQVVIHAPPERVWSVLTELEAYPEWNPFFVSAEGALVVGESLAVTMQPVGKGQQSFSPELLVLEPGRRLVWRGRLWFPGLFDGTHSFTIERVDAHSVRFTQYEDFSGVFVPFVDFEPYHRGWESMNASLKRRAERPPSATSAKP